MIRISRFLVWTPLGAWLGLGTQSCYEAPSHLWVEYVKCKWLISGEWCCLLDNGPKLTMGQPSSSLKNFATQYLRIIPSVLFFFFCFFFLHEGKLTKLDFWKKSPVGFGGPNNGHIIMFSSFWQKSKPLIFFLLYEKKLSFNFLQKPHWGKSSSLAMF